MTEDAAAPGFKQRAARELKDYAVIAAYLAVLFCAITTYTALLLRKYDADTWNYSFAIVNALVIGKVILLGEMARLGRRVEARPLYQSVLLKAFLFGLLVFAFHITEEFVKRLIHREPAGTVRHHLDYEELLARSIIVLCALIPLFAFRELGRVLGKEKFHVLLFGSGEPSIRS
jgi:hypothetical protein